MGRPTDAPRAGRTRRRCHARDVATSAEVRVDTWGIGATASVARRTPCRPTGRRQAEPRQLDRDADIGGGRWSSGAASDPNPTPPSRTARCVWGPRGQGRAEVVRAAGRPTGHRSRLGPCGSRRLDPNPLGHTKAGRSFAQSGAQSGPRCLSGNRDRGSAPAGAECGPDAGAGGSDQAVGLLDSEGVKGDPAGHSSSSGAALTGPAGRKRPPASPGGQRWVPVRNAPGFGPAASRQGAARRLGSTCTPRERHLRQAPLGTERRRHRRCVPLLAQPLVPGPLASGAWRNASRSIASPAR